MNVYVMMQRDGTHVEVLYCISTGIQQQRVWLREAGSY
jgi:hypothetical protein